MGIFEPKDIKTSYNPSGAALMKATLPHLQGLLGKPTTISETVYLFEGEYGQWVVGLSSWNSLSDTKKYLEFMRLQREARVSGDVYWLMVSPYWGPIFREHFDAHGIHYLDLSGNMHIDVPGFKAHDTGHKNKHLPFPRTKDIFGPVGSKVVRALIGRGHSRWSYPSLAEEVGTSCGQVYHVLQRFSVQGWIKSGPGMRKGKNKLTGVNGFNSTTHRLSDIIRYTHEVYNPFKHRTHAGYIYRPNLYELKQAFEDWGSRYAFNGITAAHYYSPCGEYRYVNVYIEDPYDEIINNMIGLEPSPHPNVRITCCGKHNFCDHTEIRDDLVIVDPLQCYWDLRYDPDLLAHQAAARLQEIVFKKYRVRNTPQ